VKNTEWYQIREHIKTYETFAFAPYIFLWLVLTYFLDDTLFKYLTEFVIEITKRLISY
jgi:prepilin signal peptidase PulO-like enzyme (type II secretory pathway)